MLAGGVCGILGFGGIGVATARLARGIGMKVHAINRRGRSEEPTDWIGTPDQLDMLLAASDVLVICTPLTPATQGMIGAPQLARMKEDAILVNVARGEIVDERALYERLVAFPKFTRVHRCVVDRADPPRHVPHGSAVHVAAERDRLAAQFGGGDRGDGRRGAAAGDRQYQARAGGRDAAVSGAAGGSDDVAAFVII